MDTQNAAAPAAVVTAARTKVMVAGRSRGFILAMLVLVYVVNYLDRNILSITLPYIKAEFRLPDVALGFLSGTSFAIIYATLAMPLAWVADRTNRRNVIVGSMLLFSAMTVACAYAANFWSLVVARVFTGVGEAGTSPSVNSIISDLYSPKERAGALAIYSSGLNIGLLLAFLAGGWITEHFGWRNAFFTAGVPGLILAVMFLMVVPEPKRGHVEDLKDDVKSPPFAAVVAFLWSQRSFRWLAIGTALSSFGGYAGVSFTATFLERSHHMNATDVGLVLALLAGVAGGLGTYFAGVFADRFAKRDVRWNLYVPIIFIFIAMPFTPFFYLSPSLTVALLCAIVPSANGAAYIGPAYAMTQGLVPLRMRAQSAAILLFVLNILGYGLGPLTVGELSDLLHPSLGDDSLRWALLATIIPWLISAWCYWRATRTLKADLARGAGLSRSTAPT